MTTAYELLIGTGLMAAICWVLVLGTRIVRLHWRRRQTQRYDPGASESLRRLALDAAARHPQKRRS